MLIVDMLKVFNSFRVQRMSESDLHFQLCTNIKTCRTASLSPSSEATMIRMTRGEQSISFMSNNTLQEICSLPCTAGSTREAELGMETETCRKSRN